MEGKVDVQVTCSYQYIHLYLDLVEGAWFGMTEWGGKYVKVYCGAGSGKIVLSAYFYLMRWDLTCAWKNENKTVRFWDCFVCV